MLSLKELKAVLSACNCDGAAFFDEEGELIISYKLELDTAKRVSDLITVLVSISNNFGGDYVCIKGINGYISVIDCESFFMVLTSEKEIKVDTVEKLVKTSFLSENCSGI
ncbi:hypothetical protein GWK41_00660 [Persephonella atlantica]|uniref:Roadblock/LAMTOR2 domain-containing protein n=1 Tax=Persephonella atlantica TaxID=2699429 RepID=A0ABS1GFL8_9AQUI|nr:hypothetical protein [Persephonella atlantica]MBK3331572.1 hypothetical protein [Persephonella atlantica]